MGEDMEGKICQTTGCGKPAKLQCPNCLKLSIEDSHFCSQECFKGFWASHKEVHKLAKLKSPYNPWPHFQFTGLLRPARQTPKRQVPEAISRPDYAHHPTGQSAEEQEARHSQVKQLDDEEKEGMKVVCKLAREVINEAAKAIQVGITTDELDRIVHEASIERECYPSPLGYYGFPKSVCTSVNEVICHGIPDLRVLQDGDVCNVDVTVYHRGFHGDLNETLLVGNVDDESIKLIKVTHDCISEAIKIVRPGVKFREIGQVIQKNANAHGFSVVRTFCGHGIHRLFHTVPNIPHYAMPWYEQAFWHGLGWLGAENKAMGVMQVGNCFTIEPMINAGQWQDERWPDDWTAVTIDGKRSAQFEQTLLVTETGCEILTKRQEQNGRPWFMDQLEKQGRLGILDQWK